MRMQNLITLILSNKSEVSIRCHIPMHRGIFLFVLAEFLKPYADSGLREVIGVSRNSCLNIAVDFGNGKVKNCLLGSQTSSRIP
jgi:hypothetical protein